ncbi:MAG: hypothetical protein ABIQ13_02475 [Pedococcus sp.]
MNACIGALGAALSSQHSSGVLLTQLSRALTTAAATLQQQAATAATGGGTSTPGTAGTTNGTTAGGTLGQGPPAGGSVAGNGGGSAGSTATKEVAVLKAQAALASAQQALAGSALKSPITGVVGSVGIAAGGLATTSSSVVIVGSGAALVSTTVPLSQLGLVRVAQSVDVVPAGTTTTVPGAIQSIGVLPASTTSTTPTYPVVVAVSKAPLSLATGSQASATITLASVDGVLTVPVSALGGVSAGSGSVTVVTGASTTATRVTVGAVGQGRAQILTGLTHGQTVVLADPSTPLPSANSLLTRRFGTEGGLGVGGAGGGGGSGRGN